MNYGNVFYRSDDGHIAVDLWDDYVIYHLVDGGYIVDTSIGNSDINIVYIYHIFDEMKRYRRTGKNPAWGAVEKRAMSVARFKFRKRLNNGIPQMWLPDDQRQFQKSNKG